MAKRLKKEAKDLAENPLDFASAEPDGDNLFEWNASVIGPEGSPYEGGVFQVKMSFPVDYPFKAATISFQTRIYHPSVKETGEVCNDIIGGNWKPTLNAKYILNVIYSMMEEPSPENALMPEIATQLQNNKDEFEKTAKEYTQKYAS